MLEQDNTGSEEPPSSSDEAYDYTSEPELDDDTLRSNEQRSRYFMAAMSFLLALLCLSAYLNHIPSLNDTFLQLGAVLFAAIGLVFLLRGSPTKQSGRHASGELGEHYADHADDVDGADDAVEEESGSRLYERGYRDVELPGEPALDDEDEDEDEDAAEGELTPFELLVQEALATIPPEFQQRMENTFVRVVYEPGEAVLRRVGTKEGYTLLGLYEGVPLTTYGRQYSTQPETITDLPTYHRTLLSRRPRPYPRTGTPYGTARSGASLRHRPR